MDYLFAIHKTVFDALPAFTRFNSKPDRKMKYRTNVRVRPERKGSRNTERGK